MPDDDVGIPQVPQKKGNAPEPLGEPAVLRDIQVVWELLQLGKALLAGLIGRDKEAVLPHILRGVDLLHDTKGVLGVRPHDMQEFDVSFIHVPLPPFPPAT